MEVLTCKENIKLQMKINGSEYEILEDKTYGKSDLELVKLFSVYNFQKNKINKIKNEKNIISNLEKIEGKKNKNSTNKNNLNKKQGKKNKTMENIEYIKDLVSILSEKRADNHNDWIKVGWCLHNIDYDLLEDWIKFSSKSDKCNIEGIEHGRSRERCEYLWETMEDGGLELGSLHRWAKQDNEKKYNLIVKEDLSILIKNSLNMSHYDI